MPRSPKTFFLESVEKMVTKESWKTLVQQEIDRQELNLPFRSALLEETIGYHPDPTKVDGPIKYLEIRMSLYKQRTLFFKDDVKIDSIGYNTCISTALGLKSPSTQCHNVQKAFRREIVDGRNQFMKENITDNKGKCADCQGIFPTRYQSENNVHIQVDHIESFNIIYSDFINEHDINPDTIQLEKDDWFAYCLADYSLRTKWIKYHDDRVKYQLLCSPCNIKKGKN